MLRKFLKQFEVFTPILPLLFCAYIFLAADFYPTSDPEQLGLVWDECRISDDTYVDVSNPVQVERCFKTAEPAAPSSAASVEPADLQKPFLVAANNPYQLDGKSIFIGRMGVKYFVVYDGHKIGPTFDAIQTDSSCEDPAIIVDAYPGHYIFRGVRGGQYILVEISATSSPQ